jgi:hypothetical protein
MHGRRQYFGAKSATAVGREPTGSMAPSAREPLYRHVGRNTRPTAVLTGRGHRTEDVMRHVSIAIALSGALLAAAISSGQAGTPGVARPPTGYGPMPYAYGAPHGPRPHPAHGPPPRYQLPPYAYSLPPRYGPPPQYGPLSTYVPTSPPGYGPDPAYSPPPRTDPPQSAMPHDPTARFKAWNEIADSLTEALLQLRLASSHHYSEITSRSATRPR